MTDIYRSWWLPRNFSVHGTDIDRLIVVLHVFMAIVFVGWLIYLIYCLIRFRARKGHSPNPTRRFRLPLYLEIGFAGFEVILLLFFSVPIFAKLQNGMPAEKDAVVVRITAEQYAWNIHYPGRDGKFGKTRLDLVDGTNPLGLDREDPDAKDDIVSINNFHVPVNKPVIVHLTAKDVIHNFFLPVMRVKQDAIPGSTVPVWFEATQSGEFEIACAQLCGLGHYRMKGLFYVDTDEAFRAWMEEEERILKEEMGQG